MALQKLCMSEFNNSNGKGSDVTNPSFWRYIIYVSISIVMIIAVSKFIFTLVPERSAFVRTQQVANETYKKYSQKLEAISEESAKEIEATAKDS